MDRNRNKGGNRMIRAEWIESMSCYRVYRVDKPECTIAYEECKGDVLNRCEENGVKYLQIDNENWFLLNPLRDEMVKLGISNKSVDAILKNVKRTLASNNYRFF